MTRGHLYIAGDWGTTRLRLFLCRDGQVLEQRTGPGAAQVSQAAQSVGFAATLRDLTAPWRRAHGALPVWLSGMVGARNGWREAPYVPCPADASALSAALLDFVEEGQAITITPGLTCTNPLGAPDVLRGEETQVIGLLALSPELAAEPYVCVLPGTHCKWVLVEAGCIVRFQTSFSGELYALLRDYSTLVRANGAARSGAPSAVEQGAFIQGVARARELRGAPLTHLLFETRSRQLVGDLGRPQALAFLSGLIIGQEVSGAMELFGAPRRVALVGTPVLVELYRAVFAYYDVHPIVVDAEAATRAGLARLVAMAHNSGSGDVRPH